MSVLVATTLLAGGLAVGCDDEVPDEPEPADQRDVDEADEDEPVEPTGLFRDVDCVGEDDREELEGARLAWGLVAGPDGRVRELETDDAQLGDLVADDQSPVADAPVALGRIDERAAPEDEPIVATRTDGTGRWCLEVPDRVERPGPWMIFAEDDEVLLRDGLGVSAPMVVDGRSEALVRLLVDEGHRVDQLEPEAFDDLRERAREAVVGVEPRPEAGTESAVARFREALEADPRFGEALDSHFREETDP